MDDIVDGNPSKPNKRIKMNQDPDQEVTMTERSTQAAVIIDTVDTEGTDALMDNNGSDNGDNSSAREATPESDSELGAQLKPQDPKIAAIAPELMNAIAENLNTQDYNNLRLANKEVAKLTHQDFRRRFFKKRQFMVSTFSLGTLQHIADSDMACAVEEVIFGCDYLGEDQMPPEAVRADQYRAAMNDQNSLFRSGHVINLLEKAFVSLPNLECISIRDYNYKRIHPRPGDSYSIASYGAPTIQRQTGIRTMRAASTRTGASFMASQIFVVVLLALGRAKLNLSRIEVLRHTNGPLDPSAFSLPEYTHQDVLPIIGNLKTLLLAMTTISALDQNVIRPFNGPLTANGCPDLPIRYFFTHLTKVEHLRLNFMAGEYPKTLMQWLAEPVRQAPKTDAVASPVVSDHAGPDKAADTDAASTTSADQIVAFNTGTDAAAALPTDPALLNSPLSPPPMVFPMLRRLDLGTVALDHKLISPFIRKQLDTLKELNLHKVSLIDNRTADTGPWRNQWASFLGDLRGLPGLELHHMSISEPYQLGPVSISRQYPVYFKSLRNDPPKKRRARIHRGSRVKNWIAEVELDIVQFEPLPDSETESNTSDSNSDDS